MSLRQTREIAVIDGSQNGRITCWKCHGETSWAHASMCGGMCARCYEAYLFDHTTQRRVTHRDAMMKLTAFVRQMTSEQRDHKAWARALRDREASGEKLNERQREAWRTALGHVEEAA